ncbi:hypothetical protein HOD96_02990 [Candidatus Falkowbacteria bacterium]|nr:hypothetical protein [Candidatus Falkowbacteria bacterium]MBT4432773.1 hypothetical protein [Candidatus Falkowbacteria bacterium]
MKTLKSNKRQFIILLIASFFGALLAIVHGIFFDLDIGELGRLTIGGTFATTAILFLVLLFLEWVFDLDNEKKIDELTKEIEEIKKKIK